MRMTAACSPEKVRHPVDDRSGDEAKKSASFEFIKFCVNPENQAYWNSIIVISHQRMPGDRYLQGQHREVSPVPTALISCMTAPQYVGSLLSVFLEVRQYVKTSPRKYSRRA